MSNLTHDEQPAPRKATTNVVERIFNPGSEVRFGNDYLRLSKTLTYSYLFALPLVVLYEVGIFLVNSGSPFGVRIGADVMLKRALSLIGLDNTLLFAAVVLVAGAAVFIYERRHRLPIVSRYFGYMLAESAVYAVVIGSLVAIFVGGLFGMSLVPSHSLQVPGESGTSIGAALVLSLGAGVYEELIFRVALVTLLYALLQLVPVHDRIRYVLAALVGAAIFSAVHYVGSLGDSFTLSSFTFRFLMGLALNWIFLLRGFGIAAMTHALYDVYVTVV